MSENKKRRILVTAALPYSNGRPHVGHVAGAYLPSDIFVRFMRLKGADVRYVCGSDDHGVAIMLCAQKEGKNPAELSKFYNEAQKRAFDRLGIHFDVYSSTSRCPHHAKTSQDFFLKMMEKGYFEKKRTPQFFDEVRNIFLPDRFVKGTCGYCGAVEQNGDQCEACGKMLDTETLKDAKSIFTGSPASVRETAHWFLDLSRFSTEVKEWLEKATIREHTKSYVNGLLSVGLVNRSMTRDIEWGIPVPLPEDPDAEGKVLYVWFDAPIGYISNTKELCEKLDGDAQAYEDWWKSKDTEIFHFIGEDNTIFHCVVWIAMLAAEGSFQLPKAVIVNQYLNIQFPGKEEEKMSKSRGAAIWIEDYLDAGGNPDTMRYYLTMIAPEKARTAYRPDDLAQRNNSELADVLGNFVNRVTSFCIKNVSEEVPSPIVEKESDIDRTFAALTQSTHTKITALLDDCQFKAAIEAIMEYARACNKYIDEKKPWATRKTDMDTTKNTMAHAISAIRSLAIWLSPFMPFTAEKMLKMLGLEGVEIHWEDAQKPLSGTKLQKPEILFTKLDLAKPEVQS